MKVVFTRSARTDLEAIGDYIAQDNPRRAVSFVREMRAAALALAEMPEAFPLVPRYERYGIRRRSFGNYLIFYRAEAELVVILHVLHGIRARPVGRYRGAVCRGASRPSQKAGTTRQQFNAGGRRARASFHLTADNPVDGAGLWNSLRPCVSSTI